MRRFSPPFLSVVIAASTAALTLVALAAPSNATSSNGHLYAVVGQWDIQRFPLFGGIPSHQLDLTIHNHGPVLAVAADGTVAAQRSSSPTIDFFAPGQTNPERSLNVQPPRQRCRVNIVGLVFDAARNLYVSRAVPDPCYLDGIAVYGPHASGNARPIVSILAASGALAIDPRNGELFDSVGGEILSTGAIYVFGDLSTHLRKMRTIIGAAQFAQGIAINPDCCAPGLWTYNVPYGPSPAAIWAADSLVEYNSAAVGLSEPMNGIFPELADQSTFGTVGYWKGKLYATFANINARGVEVFPNDGVGPQQPLATLTFAACCISHFAVGP